MTSHVVITGANRGIGLALTHEYLTRGCEVSAICRRSSNELESSGARIISGVDVTNPESLQSLNNALQDSEINILINNAGILRNDKLGDTDFIDVLQQFEVNAMGPLRTLECLINKFAKNAKIALITSRMGSVTDNTSGGYYGYRMSKAALNAAGKSLAVDLSEKGIAVALLHPGFVQTEMVNNSGDITPQEAAQRLACRIDDLNLDNSGTFWHSNGEILPW